MQRALDAAGSKGLLGPEAVWVLAVPDCVSSEPLSGVGRTGYSPLGGEWLEPVRTLRADSLDSAGRGKAERTKSFDPPSFNPPFGLCHIKGMIQFGN